MAHISIDQISIWNQGISINCNQLTLNAIEDNLQSRAVFYYSIDQKTDIVTNEIITGNLVCNDAEYIEWLTNDFSTIWILAWACNKLNLTIDIKKNL
jgi:hypothetical protein